MESIYLDFQVVAMVQFHFGVLNFFNHLPETVGEVKAAFRNTAEVHRQVCSCGRSLFNWDHNMIVGRIIAKQFKLGHDDVLAPDSILVIKRDLERWRLFKEVDLKQQSQHWWSSEPYQTVMLTLNWWSISRKLTSKMGSGLMVLRALARTPSRTMLIRLWLITRWRSLFWSLLWVRLALDVIPNPRIKKANNVQLMLSLLTAIF